MNDLIERSKAIDAIYWEVTEVNSKEMAENILSDVPTVDAVKVVRCKDCKWWNEDDNGLYGYCMAMRHGYMSANWEIGIYRKYKGDFYCADGERRGYEVE